MKLRVILSLCMLLVVTLSASITRADTVPVAINFGADDYGTLTIDGTLLGTYDNIAASGSFTVDLNLSQGWHTISMDYKNRFGTNGLGLAWQLPDAATFAVVPLEDMRSLNQDGTAFINGLKADYYNLDGSYLFTIYGEGPINHEALSFSSEIYEGRPGLWAGVFGPSALFEEKLNGEIFVPGPTTATPESSTLLMTLCGLGLLAATRSLLGTSKNT